MKFILFVFLLLFANLNFMMLFAQDDTAGDDSFVDSRDGKTYKTITAGDQVWMAQNLNFESESSSWYQDKKKFGKRHGRLYTWKEALEVCPSGWRLPSDKDWNELIGYFGGGKEAGAELKASGSSGFDVFFSGFRDSVGTYYDLGHDANFWTSVSVGEYEAWRCYFDRGYTEVVQDYFSKAGGLSIRCIKED